MKTEDFKPTLICPDCGKHVEIETEIHIHNNEEYITLNSPSEESWSCTNELRWKKEFAHKSDECAMKVTLQQKWQGTKSGAEWRDVPTVTE
jgi:hypothetical protein